ncbi:flavin reductase family protein [Streptomyces hoynatensis]|uniref:Flavin reductase family protein n=1 Tax=Streptomyces hoynatensis TaxID=1141874 RepID=A0A3A9Z0V7_9ACTN|nr:flavin reductase family protein [Streptomyces hoynatensis]
MVLVSTLNEDGSPNLAPMSSVFWLGHDAMLGLGSRAQTTRNLLATRECVLNLPSDALAPAVDRLALTTGSSPVPPVLLRRGYRHERDKFGISGLTPLPAQTVAAPRVAECPVNLEATLTASYPMGDGGVLAHEVRVRRIHVHESIRLAGTRDRIDPDAWRPLIMSFQQFYGLGPRVHPSTLARIPEHLYRGAPQSPEARPGAVAEA